MQNENRLPQLKNSPNWIVVPMIALAESSKTAWLYGVENLFSPSASKSFLPRSPTPSSKGYRAWFQQLNIFVRVGTRGYIVLSIPKGRG